MKSRRKIFQNINHPAKSGNFLIRVGALSQLPVSCVDSFVLTFFKILLTVNFTFFSYLFTREFYMHSTLPLIKLFTVHEIFSKPFMVPIRQKLEHLSIGWYWALGKKLNSLKMWTLDYQIWPSSEKVCRNSEKYFNLES